jgi:hypothetical protein
MATENGRRESVRRRNAAEEATQRVRGMPAPHEDRRFVAFVDMLGYKAVVLSDSTTGAEKFNALHSIYENLAQAARDCVGDLTPALPAPVRWVQFSDAFFFSSRSAVSLATTAAQFFANVFSLHGAAGIEGGEWLPFLRGGIAYDWMFEGFDPTAGHAGGPDAFRNPIGPAVAKAYLVGETTGVEGMRLVASAEAAGLLSAELDALPPGHPIAARAARLRPYHLARHPACGELFEVPWFELHLLGDDTGAAFAVLEAAGRQFSFGSIKHLRGTADGLLRTPGVQAVGRLRDRAAALRDALVRRMAGERWLRRGGGPGDDWADWFAAEGRAPP